MQAAAARPDAITAVASFHAGKLASEDESSPHRLLPRVSAEVVADADKDASMPPKDQRRLEQALTDAGLVHTAELYPGASHGFTMSDTAVYDEAATERHRTRCWAPRPDAAEASGHGVGWLGRPPWKVRMRG